VLVGVLETVLVVFVPVLETVLVVFVPVVVEVGGAELCVKVIDHRYGDEVCGGFAYRR
jgi:hypothetical protein